MITLNEQQVKELEQFINTIPTAYGLPLLQFLGKLAQEQNPQTEANDFTNNPNDPNAGLG
jgi:hypothetical protein